MKKLIKEMKEQMDIMTENIDKTTKVAEAITRKASLTFEKLGKRYRKESVAQHK